MARVSIRDLNKKYDNGFHAVKDVNLEIRDKEFVVLVGPSGCGKTTTLRMVAGLEEITSGEILIGTRVINDLPPMDRDIAMVFQNYALYPHKSVYQNMVFGLQMRKYPQDEIEKRVREAADILGIGPLLERKPRQLSGGQRQRVAVGRAIVRHPQVFLFDEPLSNLDAMLRVQMRVELKRLHERLETTAIYVTHDQVEAMTLGDRVVVMKDGWVQQVGEPLELYGKPSNKFVAGFIGSPAMNFVDVTISDSGGALWADAESLRLKVPPQLGERVFHCLDARGAREPDAEHVVSRRVEPHRHADGLERALLRMHSLERRHFVGLREWQRRGLDGPTQRLGRQGLRRGGGAPP